MPDDTSTADTTAADDTGAGADAGGGESKLTQAEVNRIVGREKAAAERAALAKVAADLGMTVDEAKAALAAKDAADKAQMTEADRKLAEAAERDRKAGEREASAAARERRADIRAALADQNVPSKVAARLLGLVDSELGENSADDDHITAAIEAVKADLPALFAAPDPAAANGVANGAAKPPPNGDPRGKPPAAGQATVTPMQRGAERATRMGLAKSPVNQPA